jgi:N-acetylglutamate synthase-like GNAT family acetyltransferase
MAGAMADRYVTLTAENLDEHHVCCALGDPKHREGVERKKAWLRERFREGLVFRKLDVRGKVFIEYAPGETAWRPIVADGWLVIHCLWVSGQHAGKGHAKALVDSCLADARRQRKAGVVVATAATKRPFLSDPRFFRKRGFELVETAGEFLLLARRLRPGGPDPSFAEAVKRPGRSTRGCFVGRYTDQCPFNLHWAEEVASVLRRAGHSSRVERITALQQARQVKSPLGTYGLERDGVLVTHQLLGESGVHRLLDEIAGGR